ncbi:TPA: hypothetical protein ME969_001335 [Klebsiella pneumoniae]|uniref:hypothetical protein n=1 Tax=Klebsiella pneumoniae TaxID=573 RepID=UPI00058F2573|nr:hypothetical protein [Klebsiella pneumoniae]HDU4693806.1 hypothetical protein [Klebsiella pneumoniae subsp. pneumoniae]KSV30139.1 hypothetical protein AT478_22595 [Klebsiella pneumoniae]MBC4969652.1 hypothetical protein [Klebsiella pneumoniae]MCJ4064518.1 hypothetical protein [Klebsiella pneumoniae]MCJ5252554.1 hypothetical protein [Klebsiella pneumoniae]
MITKKFIELEVGDIIVPVPGVEITVASAPVLTKTDDGENHTLKGVRDGNEVGVAGFYDSVMQVK